MKSGDGNDDNALATPLSIKGTCKEIDEQLSKQLLEFVSSHLGLSSTLKSAKEQIDAAAKAARGSRREIGDLEIPQRIQQECESKPGASADRLRDQRELR